MSNYQTVICIGDTSIYKVPEIKEFLDNIILFAGGFFSARYDPMVSEEITCKILKSKCENSKFILKAMKEAKNFVAYSDTIVNKLSEESFNAFLEHEKAHLEFKDHSLDPTFYHENIDVIELKADEKAASVVGKETMKKALIELLNILVQNLMDNNPNGRSFEYNYNFITNTNHFKKRLEALS